MEAALLLRSLIRSGPPTRLLSNKVNAMPQPQVSLDIPENFLLALSEEDALAEVAAAQTRYFF
jgi:hypothetical protein